MITVEEIKKIVGDLPYMTPEMARWFTDLIHSEKLIHLLEIGHFHGVSSCYLAAAVEPIGGTLTTIDVTSNPSTSINELLAKCNLRNVEIFLEPPNVGGEWRLMYFLKEGRSFDFCYIDSLHEWSCASAQFGAVAQLLRPGGWMIMDDIEYAYKKHPVGEHPWLDVRPRDQLEERQVGNVWNLLVKRDIRFHKFTEIFKMGVCQKKPVQPA